jgi:hypothetical protein
MKQSLIFSAVGIPIEFYPEAYDSDNHWRYTKPERLYETVLYRYNNLDVEPNTYDYISWNNTGFKWQIAYKFLQEFDWTDYEYVGFFDDDLITDINNINRAIKTAYDKRVKLFQLSTYRGSESSHGILHQREDLEYSITGFIEGMCNFVHTSCIPTLLKLWDLHDFKSGYGFDVILTKVLKEKAMVVHSSSVYHPPASFKGYTPSYYKVDEANREMHHIFQNVYPDFMMKQYNEYVLPLFGIDYSVYEEVKRITND